MSFLRIPLAFFLWTTASYFSWKGEGVFWNSLLDGLDLEKVILISTLQICGGAFLYLIIVLINLNKIIVDSKIILIGCLHAVSIFMFNSCNLKTYSPLLLSSLELFITTIIFLIYNRKCLETGTFLCLSTIIFTAVSIEKSFIILNYQNVFQLLFIIAESFKIVAIKDWDRKSDPKITSLEGFGLISFIALIFLLPLWMMMFFFDGNFQHFLQQVKVDSNVLNTVFLFSGFNLSCIISFCIMLHVLCPISNAFMINARDVLITIVCSKDFNNSTQSSIIYFVSFVFSLLGVCSTSNEISKCVSKKEKASSKSSKIGISMATIIFFGTLTFLALSSLHKPIKEEPQKPKTNREVWMKCIEDIQSDIFRYFPPFFVSNQKV